MLVLLDEALRDPDVLVGNGRGVDRDGFVVAPRILEVLTIEGTIDRDLPLRAAANGANVAADTGTEAPGTASFANRAGHSLSIEVGGNAHGMSRTNLFFKVEIEHDPEEKPEKIGDEIRRQLMKFYGVRDAELSNYSTVES
jgi:hypothetical protein